MKFPMTPLSCVATFSKCFTNFVLFSFCFSSQQEAHVNTCYKHFYYFVQEFELISPKELEPLAEMTAHVCKDQTKSHHIVLIIVDYLKNMSCFGFEYNIDVCCSRASILLCSVVFLSIELGASSFGRERFFFVQKNIINSILYLVTSQLNMFDFIITMNEKWL